ncbi:PASTA domain-containing protein [Nakamurella sp.]|uniref:PASTA domain-containing protein n=1 Tax=Nakamurella sp. TaxID=1869182 RepID=UPI003B3AA1F1
MSRAKTLVLAGTAALAVLGLAACGTTPTGSQPVTQAPVTVTQAPVTVTQAPVTITQESSSPAPPALTQPAEITSQKTTSDAPAAAGADSVKVPMPDVVGMNLQAAQDKIQTLGVFFSRSEDATGAGRAQVIDRNWVVVSQSPEPGVPIGEGDALLYVEKIGG